MTKTYKLNDVEVSQEDLRQLIKENPELLEERRGRFKPEHLSRYFVVNPVGDIEENEWFADDHDKHNYNSNNCFETEEEAIQAREMTYAITRVTDRIHELNGDWEPDWGDYLQEKLSVYYDHDDEEFDDDFNTFCQADCRLPYMKSGEVCEQIIKDHLADLKLIFNIHD